MVKEVDIMKFKSEKGPWGKSSEWNSQKEFLRTIWLALNPWRYDELKERGMVNLFKYFFSFVLVVFVISVLMMTPTIVGFVDNSLAHFNELSIDINTSMNSPLLIPSENPLVTIDTRQSEGTLNEGRMLVTDDYIYTKTPFGKVKQTGSGQYKDILGNEWFLVGLMIMLTPSLLFIFYLGYVIKILLIILLAAILGVIVSRFIRFEVYFRDLFKVGLIGSTIMIIIDMIRLPLGLNLYYSQYLVFLIFFVIGMVRIGEFEGSRGKKQSKYVDMSKI
jgi:hypothetical protein